MTPLKLTKIIATMGPAIATIDAVRSLANTGVDIFRGLTPRAYDLRESAGAVLPALHQQRGGEAVADVHEVCY